MSQVTDPAAFRSQFPVFERVSYLNAGTEGPVSSHAAQVARARIEFELTSGRCGPDYFESVMGLAEQARAGYASVLGCDPADVALTGSTTDGVNTILSGLQLRSGDEILTSDEEHPGLLAPLARARDQHGISIRVVPFDELAGAVSPSTRLIAASHVSWVGGKMIDAAALARAGVSVLLDAAQGVGAVPVDVHALGCDYYAGSGQKWLSGPEGSGCLYVKRERLDDLVAPWPGFSSLADPHDPLGSGPADDVKRLDHGFPVGLRNAWAVASMEVLAQAGWEWIHERAATLAAGLADGLAERGLQVAPRSRSTLVSWATADPDADVKRLASHGIVVRSIPSHNLVRASVGAWSSEEELERLVELAAT